MKSMYQISEKIKRQPMNIFQYIFEQIKETCPNPVNSEILRISELKIQYKDKLITMKLTKFEGTQGTHGTQRIHGTRGPRGTSGIHGIQIRPRNPRTPTVKPIS